MQVVDATHESTRHQEAVERAYWIATNGRPGPVWIDVPIDVQSSQVSWEALPASISDATAPLLPQSEQGLADGDELRRQIEAMYGELSKAKRPVILASTGVRISGMYREFLLVVEKLKNPGGKWLECP